MDAATKSGGVTAVVDYEYQAQEPDELDLEKGDIIHNIKQMPGGWWEGTLQSNGKTGMFPDNFVRVIETNEENPVILRDKSTIANRRCKVIFSYTQVNDDELTLAVGDVIEFLGEVEEGWWRGRLNNKTGVFPSNFVVAVEPSPVFATKRLPSTIIKNNSRLIGGTDVGSVSVAAASAAVPIASVTTTSVTSQATKKINRLSMHSSKEDLLSSSISTTTSSTTTPATSTIAVVDDVPSLPPKPQREYCRVEFPYAPQNEDELDLKVGDIITIISMELPDKGWWKGELKGRIGVFPDNFVKLLPPSEVAPLNDTQPSNRTAKTSTSSLVNNVTNQQQSTSSTTIANSNSLSSSTTSKVLIRKTGTTTATTSITQQQQATSNTTGVSTNRKESFGSRDSLNDILSETGLPSGNVAAQRKSLENKNLDLSNPPPMGLKKLQREQQQQQETKSSSSLTTTTTMINNNTSNSVITSSTTSSSLGSSSTSNDLRKSLENLDDKSKTTPPPVLTKKPSVPNKKTSSVTSVAGNIFSGLKQKVKNVENKLTTAASHDYADGIASSKISPSSGVADSGAPGGYAVMRRANTIAVEDSEFDSVERASILTDVRANRVKAPKRRPPSAAINVIGESNNNSSMYLNGAASLDTGAGPSTIEESKVQSSDDNSTGEDQLAKPKPREWEKKKAPWMEELKASQVKKKTSPNVEPSPVSSERSTTINNSSLSNNVATSATSSSIITSSSSVASTSTKVQSSTISSSVMQQSVNVESSSGSRSPTRIQFFKKDSGSEVMSKSLSSKMVADASSSLASDELRSTRPNSLSIRNRSISPSLANNRNSMKGGSTNSLENNSNSVTIANNSSTVAKTSSSSTSSTTIVNNIHHTNDMLSNNIVTSNGTSGGNGASSTTTTTNHSNSQNSSIKVIELEKRVDKLEALVHSQQRMIEDLVRSLREETDRVRILRGELDKYAQCVTQV